MFRQIYTFSKRAVFYGLSLLLSRTKIINRILENLAKLCKKPAEWRIFLISDSWYYYPTKLELQIQPWFQKSFEFKKADICKLFMENGLCAKAVIAVAVEKDS
jgi:hypothetical protein